MDIAKEIEQIIKEAVNHIETADGVADIVAATLNTVKESGLSGKTAKVLDLTLDVLSTAFEPFTKRWRAHKDEWFKHQVGLIKEAANTTQLSEAGALEILKMSRAEDQVAKAAIETAWWKRRAESLEQKLEAKSKADPLSGLLERVMKISKKKEATEKRRPGNPRPVE
jgi:hypothetical protein